MTLDQQCFQAHVLTPAFQDGVIRGYWDVASKPAIAWPHVHIWVAAPPRVNAPDRYCLRFLLKDYPEKGPTSVVWDPERNERLELTKWPKGVNDVAMVFRTNWNNAPSLYAPWDRIAMDAHPDWAGKYSGLNWKRTGNIAHYLHLTYELLASEDYHGC